MAARKGAAPKEKKPGAGVAKPRAKKAPAPKGTITRRATAKKPAGAEPEAESPKAKAPPAPKPAEEKIAPERVIFPPALYGERKEDVKAPLKDLGLKWQYLGTGKGIYRGDAINVFFQYTDELGADYTIRGTDRAAASRLLAAWKAILGASTLAEAKEKAAEATVVEKAEAESEAMRLWRLGEPQRREGEPEGFFKRRVAEWTAKRPSG